MKLAARMTFMLGALSLPFLLGSVLTGCGEVKQARVPRVAGEAGSLRGMGRPFNPHDIEFLYTQMIMWNADMTPSSIAGALNASTQYDAYQDEIYDRLVTIKGLKKKFCEAIPDGAEEGKCFDLVDYAKALPELERKQGELKSHEKNRDDKNAELAKLKEQVPPTDTTPQKIADLEAALKTLNAKIKQIQRQIKPTLESQAKVKTAGLESDVPEFQKQTAELADYQAKGTEQLNIINQAGHVLDKSTTTFAFKRGDDLRFHANIQNFDLSKFLRDETLAEIDVPSTFSTENFTMGKVTYSEVGEFYTFEVYTPKAVYFFKPARTKHDAKDKRIHFKGDVIRCGTEDGKIGRAQVTHTRDELRDIVGCGVDLSGWLDAAGKLPDELKDKVSAPVLRRGVAILNDLDEKE